MLGWHWPALLVTLPWLWYRKLYIWGLGLFLIGPLSGILFGAVVADMLSVGIPIVVALFAKRIYIDHARCRILKIDQRNLAPQERDSLIERVGGVSTPGAVLGSIIVISMVVLPILVQRSDHIFR